jgi:hypothetical protein
MIPVTTAMLISAWLQIRTVSPRLSILLNPSVRMAMRTPRQRMTPNRSSTTPAPISPSSSPITA